MLSLLRGFIKCGASGKLTGCEPDLAINLPGCFRLLFLFSFITKNNNARLKNPTDLPHKNLMKPLINVVLAHRIYSDYVRWFYNSLHEKLLLNSLYDWFRNNEKLVLCQNTCTGEYRIQTCTELWNPPLSKMQADKQFLGLASNKFRTVWLLIFTSQKRCHTVHYQQRLGLHQAGNWRSGQGMFSHWWNALLTIFFSLVIYQ